MILRKSPLKRTSAVFAGALLGLTGVAVLATPASAHHTTITPGSPCVLEDESWQVTWTVQNSEIRAAKVTGVTFDEGSKLTGIDGAELPENKGSIEGIQVLPKDAATAKLTVTAFWDYPEGSVDVTRTNVGEAVKPTKLCAPAKPPVDEETPGDEETPTDEESTPVDNPSAPVDEPSSPAEEPSTPAEEPSAPTAPVTPEPAEEPEFVYEADCDTVVVGVTVPSDWDEDIEVTFTTNKGGKETVTGVKGETTTVEFPAEEGLTVTATPKGYEDEAATIEYEQPADCDTAGEGAGEGDEELPLTGAAAGGIATGAVVLLGAGIALFVVARRRKVKFTA